jgi:hypothetical protein
LLSQTFRFHTRHPLFLSEDIRYVLVFLYSSKKKKKKKDIQYGSINYLLLRGPSGALLGKAARTEGPHDTRALNDFSLLYIKRRSEDPNAQ